MSRPGHGTLTDAAPGRAAAAPALTDGTADVAAVRAGPATALRGLLPFPVRALAQRLHRVLGVLGVGFLLPHIGVEVAGGRVSAASAALGRGGGDALVGLGTSACLLFLLAVVTGVGRGGFASRRRIRPFRLLRGASYAGWAAAAVHGLTAGRAPAARVVLSYAVCLTRDGGGPRPPPPARPVPPHLTGEVPAGLVPFRPVPPRTHRGGAAHVPPLPHPFVQAPGGRTRIRVSGPAQG
ncbi:hypothetical protein [Streptomyces mexicanus]|uniref:hypothetical protein n=1 Tax=Streptomyces mexicanus TaxID=178566 RepID=UPI0031EDB1AD